MAHLISSGDVRLNVSQRGREGTPIVFVHGNVSCLEWYDPTRAALPPARRSIAYDWRGCGGSDKPEPEAEFANYSPAVHARDLIGLLDALDIPRCHLVNHSGGGLISCHALRLAPQRFERVLWLAPVGPYGLDMTMAHEYDVFNTWRSSRAAAYAGIAGAAASLFEPDSLTPGQTPRFAASASAAQRETFETIIDRTRGISDGIWEGMAYHMHQTSTRENPELVEALAASTPHHLVVRGAEDAWITQEHVNATLSALPESATLKIFEGRGHSINLEAPEALALVIAAFTG